ncbi:MAG: hypothetical protein GVY17_04300 [Cyanobacteria bacterium]|jgi:hypothetical protein|nr:hypothetical protein [Cyanobacteria bacterium GSL.Bin21]
MLSARSLQFLFSLGLEFWLPLPFLGFGFWLLSGMMTGQVLNQLNPIEHTVSVNPQPETLFQENKIRSIQLRINEAEGITRVKVKIAAARLKELEFKFPGTDLTEVEADLAQELGLSEQEIKKLILTESNSTLHSQQIH